MTAFALCTNLCFVANFLDLMHLDKDFKPVFTIYAILFNRVLPLQCCSAKSFVTLALCFIVMS